MASSYPALFVCHFYLIYFFISLFWLDQIVSRVCLVALLFEVWSAGMMAEERVAWLSASPVPTIRYFTCSVAQRGRTAIMHA